MAVASLVRSFERAVVECAEGTSSGVDITVQVEVTVGQGSLKVGRRCEQRVPHRSRATHDGFSVVTRDRTCDVVAEMKARSFRAGVHRESEIDAGQAFWHNQHLEYRH